MKEIKTDIVIVGGGLTGLLTAFALSTLELRILLIDAGVIFSDEWTPESMGDYIIGPSHVLPTNGMAKRQSGLSVFNFLRRQSTISSTKKTINKLGPSAILLAECEGLDAHANSIKIRIKD